MTEVLDIENLKRALALVKLNKGAPGAIALFSGDPDNQSIAAGKARFPADPGLIQGAILGVMQVTHASLEDARAVAEIHVNAWRVAYESIFSAEYLASLSVEKRHAWWSECIAAGTPELLVAKSNGSVHGWLNFAACRDEGAPKCEAEIWAVYVAPMFWSTGTGRLLWLRAKQLMLEQGFTSCSLWVFPQNARAIKFYEAAGFAADSCPPKTFERDGRHLQEVRYVCQLDAYMALKRDYAKARSPSI